jgi:hypothetical protein
MCRLRRWYLSDNGGSKASFCSGIEKGNDVILKGIQHAYKNGYGSKVGLRSSVGSRRSQKHGGHHFGVLAQSLLGRIDGQQGTASV